MPEAAELFEACTFTTRVLRLRERARALAVGRGPRSADQVIDVAPYREKRDLMYEGPPIAISA